MPERKCKFNNIFYLRNIKDAQNIRNILQNDDYQDTECTVVGGGHIGMEVSSALVQRDFFKKITMIFPEQHMMASRDLFTPKIGQKYHELYK